MKVSFLFKIKFCPNKYNALEGRPFLPAEKKRIDGLLLNHNRGKLHSTRPTRRVDYAIGMFYAFSKLPHNIARQSDLHSLVESIQLPRSGLSSPVGHICPIACEYQ